MNVAVLGSGGREHALAWKLAASPRVTEVIVMPGNGGTAAGLAKVRNVAVRLDDLPAVAAACRANAVGLIVVGPEAPLVQGIRDFFAGTGVLVFGPSAAAARLEGSKIAAKEFMARHGVATAAFARAASPAAARALAAARGGVAVIKYDGLAAGKGVFVCGDLDQVDQALAAIVRAHGPAAPCVVEERLVGQEISILGVTDGRTIRLLTPSQDHKQRFEGDTGPMTGGMGAFCPVPACDAALLDRIVAEIVAPTLRGMAAEGLDYVGVLYFGVMVTAAGPKLLEYNVRLGDPEAEVLLPKLASDLVPLILSCFDGTLAAAELQFHPDFVVDVVLAAADYPGAYRTGDVITGTDDLLPDCLVFHGGTRRTDAGLVTAGGRVLNVVARGATLEEAIARAYAQAARIAFATKVCRTDIGRRRWVVA